LIRLRFPFLLCWLVVSSCAGPTYHSATPIPEDTTQLGVGFGVRGHAGPESQKIEPMPEILLRRGLSQNWDIGAKVSGPITVDLNWAFINNESFALSFNPTVVLAFSIFGGTLGFLADLIKSPDFTLTLGLKPGVFFLNDGEAMEGAFFTVGGYLATGLSGMVGAQFDLGRVTLAPTVEIIAPFIQTENLHFLAGVGILF